MTLHLRSDTGRRRIDYDREPEIDRIASVIEQQVTNFYKASMLRIVCELCRRLLEGKYDE